MLPDIARAAHIETIPAVVCALSVTAAITRVMALPSVNRWLDRWLPSLSADPYEGAHRAQIREEDYPREREEEYPYR